MKVFSAVVVVAMGIAPMAVASGQSSVHPTTTPSPFASYCLSVCDPFYSACREATVGKCRFDDPYCWDYCTIDTCINGDPNEKFACGEKCGFYLLDGDTPGCPIDIPASRATASPTEMIKTLTWSGLSRGSPTTSASNSSIILPPPGLPTLSESVDVPPPGLPRLNTSISSPQNLTLVVHATASSPSVNIDIPSLTLSTERMRANLTSGSCSELQTTGVVGMPGETSTFASCSESGTTSLSKSTSSPKPTLVPVVIIIPIANTTSGSFASSPTDSGAPPYLYCDGPGDVISCGPDAVCSTDRSAWGYYCVKDGLPVVITKDATPTPTLTPFIRRCFGPDDKTTCSKNQICSLGPNSNGNPNFFYCIYVVRSTSGIASVSGRKRTQTKRF